MADPTLFELVRVRDSAAGVERTVRRFVADADQARYTIVDKDAADRNGLPLPSKPVVQVEPLKGRELDAALDDAGLPKTGTADEKRQRLADHQTADATEAPVEASEAVTNNE